MHVHVFTFFVKRLFKNKTTKRRCSCKFNLVSTILDKTLEMKRNVSNYLVEFDEKIQNNIADQVQISCYRNLWQTGPHATYTTKVKTQSQNINITLMKKQQHTDVVVLFLSETLLTRSISET